MQPHAPTVTGLEIACFGTHPSGTTMPILTIRHVTAYHYQKPVAFGEHRIMLRPRNDEDQKVLESELEVTKRLPGNGEPEYRIKNANEPHERVARESELIKA